MSTVLWYVKACHCSSSMLLIFFSRICLNTRTLMCTFHPSTWSEISVQFWKVFVNIKSFCNQFCNDTHSKPAVNAVFSCYLRNQWQCGQLFPILCIAFSSGDIEFLYLFFRCYNIPIKKMLGHPLLDSAFHFYREGGEED